MAENYSPLVRQILLWRNAKFAHVYPLTIRVLSKNLIEGLIVPPVLFRWLRSVLAVWSLWLSWLMWHPNFAFGTLMLISVDTQRQLSPSLYFCFIPWGLQGNEKKATCNTWICEIYRLLWPHDIVGKFRTWNIIKQILNFILSYLSLLKNFMYCVYLMLLYTVKVKGNKI